MRARNAEEKQRRRSDILQAAERLWLKSTYADLSMNQVAREAKLAKGTLYLYFSTKEDLFLELLAELLRDWLAELLRDLETQRPQTHQEVAEFLIQAALPQEALRRLLILFNTVIEPSIPAEAALEFRRKLLRFVLPIVDLLPFERQVNLNILLHLYALSLGWQLIVSGASLAASPTFLALNLPALPRPTFDEGFPSAFKVVVAASVQGQRLPS